MSETPDLVMIYSRGKTDRASKIVVFYWSGKLHQHDVVQREFFLAVVKVFMALYLGYGNHLLLLVATLVFASLVSVTVHVKIFFNAVPAPVTSFTFLMGDLIVVVTLPVSGRR